MVHATTADTEERPSGTQGLAPFVRCPNCGRYIEPGQCVHGHYCSPACAEHYRRCTTCGRYFASTEAYSEEHCSRECAARYSLQRRYGPAQINIRMEELV